MFELDVGCGNKKMGDVNVDISRDCKPDVISDIHYLPFRDNQFNHVYCYHVLEHKGVVPEKAIKELVRIANGTIEIQIPHWLSPNAKKDKTHKNFQIMRRKYWMKYNPLTMTLDYCKLLPLLPSLFVVRPNNITVKICPKRT